MMSRFLLFGFSSSVHKVLATRTTSNSMTLMPMSIRLRVALKFRDTPFITSTFGTVDAITYLLVFCASVSVTQLIERDSFRFVSRNQ